MRIGFLVAALFAASPMYAQTVGLLIGNTDYQNVSDVSRGGRITRAETALTKAGMQVITRRDASLEDMNYALTQFGQMASQSNTLMVALSGRFLKSATETYFMPVDGEAGPLATLSSNALPLSTVLAWLASKPGEAVLVLVTDNGATPFGSFLSMGIGDLEIPQGVTVLVGGPKRTEKFMREALVRPGKPFVGQARRLGLKVAGYAPLEHVFIDGAASRPIGKDDRLADIRDWRRATNLNTAEAYEAYADAHPDGEFTRMAESRMRALTDTPQARAQRTEQMLDLSRNARRDIQRNLSLLGFNTRGIDGIFGRGSRTAVAEWQKAQGFPGTGYVTADQIAHLDGQAERKAKELEFEADRLRQEQLASDLAYWEETGSQGDEIGLRAYLDRYPDGEFAEVATERLAALERRKRNQASSFDKRLWDRTTRIDSVAAYEDYLLRTDRRGAFVKEADARIASLEAEARNSDKLNSAMRAEQALNLSPRTRQVIESRLKALGLKPGPVDGAFDDDTRRAIRRYQAARKMRETGYLSEAVVVRLLADTVRQIFR